MVKAYKYDISKIIIPKDHQKYLQREFPMGSGTGNILVITQALVRCLNICTRQGAARPRAVHIYQATHSCLCYNLYICNTAWADQRPLQGNISYIALLRGNIRYIALEPGQYLNIALDIVREGGF